MLSRVTNRKHLCPKSLHNFWLCYCVKLPQQVLIRLMYWHTVNVNVILLIVRAFRGHKVQCCQAVPGVLNTQHNLQTTFDNVIVIFSYKMYNVSCIINCSLQRKEQCLWSFYWPSASFGSLSYSSTLTLSLCNNIFKVACKDKHDSQKIL